jgi:hypothetical protein
MKSSVIVAEGAAQIDRKMPGRERARAEISWLVNR